MFILDKNKLIRFDENNCKAVIKKSMTFDFEIDNIKKIIELNNK